ncbi:MAG: hypothetical protein PVJ41_11780, partial [Desulfobacterales bacterium]
MHRRKISDWWQVGFSKDEAFDTFTTGHLLLASLGKGGQGLEYRQKVQGQTQVTPFYFLRATFLQASGLTPNLIVRYSLDIHIISVILLIFGYSQCITSFKTLEN